MKITLDGELAQMLTEHGLPGLVQEGSAEIDEQEYADLLKEFESGYAHLPVERREALAKYSILRRNYLPETESAQLGPEATTAVGKVARAVERQSVEFQALKGVMVEVREAVAGAAKAISDEGAQLSSAVATFDVAGRMQTAKHHLELKGCLNTLRGEFLAETSKWLTCWHEAEAQKKQSARRQMIWFWVWHIAVFFLLLFIAVRGHAQVQTVIGTRASNAVGVICDSGCAGGTTDTDDGSIAGGQTGGISIGLGYRWNGASWERITGDAANGVDVDVTRVQGNVNIVGTLTNNNAAPGATNVGVLSSRATAADPSYTEGNQVLASSTLAGYLRVTCNNCGGSTFADSTAFSFGVTAVSNVSFVVDDVATNTVAENSAGTPRMNTNRIAMFDQVNVNGVTVSTGNGVAGTGVQRVAIASDNTAFAVTANAGTNLNTSLLALETTQVDNRTALQLIDNLPHARNAAFSNSAAIGCEMDDTATVAATEGNVSPCRNDSNRSIYVQLRTGAGETGIAGTALRIDPTGTTAQPVTDNGGSLTVDAPAGTPIAVRQSDGAAFQTFDLEDLDSGAGTVNRITVGLVVAAAGGPALVPGDSTNGLKIQCTTGCGGGTQYAEDTAHVSGDQLTLAGVVQQAADAALSNDGDRSLLQVDANGFLKVNIKAGAGSGGTAMADDAAFTIAVTNFTPAGGTYRSVRDPVDDNDGGAFAMTQKRALYTTLEDSAANEIASATAQPGGAERGLIVREAQKGQATMANSQPVVIASDQSAVPASQSGTWTVQPGNTANTTAWLLKLSQTGTDNDVDATLAAETTKVIGTVRVLGNGGATVDSTVGAGTAPTNQVVTGTIYNSTEISPTTGQAFAVQADSKGRTRTVTMDGAGNTRAMDVVAANFPPTLANVPAIHALAPSNTGLPVNVPNGSVQSCGNVTASGTTVTCSITPTPGNSFVGLCGINNTGTISISDNNSNTWTTAKSQTGTVAGALVSYAVNVNSGATTFTCTAGTIGVVVVTVYEVSGLLRQIIAQPDGTDSTTASAQTSAVTTAAIVPTSPNELVFTSLVLTTNNACTAGTNWTIDTQQGAVGGRLCPSRYTLPYVNQRIAAAATIATFSSASYAQASAAFRPVSLSVEGAITITDAAGNARGVNVTAGNALVVDGSAVTQPVSITAGNFPDNEPFNVAQINGITPLMGNGITGTGSQRVTIASDNTAFTVNVGTFPANQPFNLNQIVGTTVSVNNGVVGAGVQRMTLASDSTGNIATIGTSVTPGTAAGNLGKAEDAVHASGDTGVAVWAVRSDAAGAPTEYAGTNGDYSPIATDSFGMMSGSLYAPWGWSYHENSSSALTDTTVHASCGAGLFNYISTVVFSTGAATAFNLFIEDSTTTTILGPYYLEAVAGRGAVIPIFPAKKQATAATLISVTTSAAIAHSIDISGFCGR